MNSTHKWLLRLSCFLFFVSTLSLIRYILSTFCITLHFSVFINKTATSLFTTIFIFVDWNNIVHNASIAQQNNTTITILLAECWALLFPACFPRTLLQAEPGHPEPSGTTRVRFYRTASQSTDIYHCTSFFERTTNLRGKEYHTLTSAGTHNVTPSPVLVLITLHPHQCWYPQRHTLTSAGTHNVTPSPVLVPITSHPRQCWYP